MGDRSVTILHGLAKCKGRLAWQNEIRVQWLVLVTWCLKFIVNSLARSRKNKCNADLYYGKVVVTSLHFIDLKLLG